MWDSHLKSCWRFQFSPESCKTKSELRKRVCHSLLIAFCTSLRRAVHLIHRWALRYASTTRDSFSYSGSAFCLFEPGIETFQLKFHSRNRSSYDSLTASYQFHLTSRAVNICIGTTDRSIFRSAIAVHWTLLADHWSWRTWSQVCQWHRWLSNTTSLNWQHATIEISSTISSANQIFFRWTPFENWRDLNEFLCQFKIYSSLVVTVWTFRSFTSLEIFFNFIAVAFDARFFLQFTWICINDSIRSTNGLAASLRTSAWTMQRHCFVFSGLRWCYHCRLSFWKFNELVNVSRKIFHELKTR